MRMQAGSDFAARFLKSGRVGFYLRVAERDDDAATIAEFLRVRATSATRGAGILERDCKHPGPDSERATL
jgi:hypothetical protein